MPSDTGRMRFVIETDEKGSIKKVQTLKNETTGLGKESEKTEKKYGKLVKQITCCGAALLAAKKAYDVIGESINLASDAMEANSKLGVVFEGQLDSVSEAVKNLNDNYGFSVTAAERLLGNTGDLLAGLGFQDKVVFDLSEKVQKLAGDTASFSNVQGGAEFASKALTSMLLGEKEMAKQLGIVINENDKSFKDQVKTLVEVGGMTLVQAQALVRLQEAYKQSENSIGDFSRTQDSFANQTKILNNTLEDLKVEFGKVFVEVALPILRDFTTWIKDNQDSIISGFKLIGEAINFVVGPVRALSLAADLIDQNTAAMNRAAGQAVEFEKSFDDVYAGLRRAGVSAETLNNALADQRGADEIERLTQRQRELNEWIDKGATIMNEFGAEESQLEYATAKLNEVTAEKNALLSQGIFAIVQSAEKYGIEAAQVSKLRKELQGSAKDTESETGKKQENKTVTGELNTALKETEKTYKELELVGSRKLLPWETHQSIKVQEAIEKQEDFKSTLQGTEKEIKALGITGQWALDNIIDRSEELEQEMKKSERAILDISRGLDILVGLSFIPDGLAEAFGDLKIVLKDIKDKNYTGAIANGLTAISKLSGVPDKLAVAFEGMGGVIKNLAKGDYLGAIASGVATLGKLFGGGDGVKGQAEAAEKALYELGVTGEDAIKKLADAYEELLSSMSMKDFADMTAEDWENLMNDMGDMAKDVAKDTAEWWEPMKDAIKPLEDFLAVPAKNAEDFNAQAGITLDVFTGLLKSGMRITEALREMDGPFEKLIASQDELGLKGNKAFEELKKFRSLIKENEALVKSVEGLNAVLELTASRSALSQESADNYMKSLATKSAELEKAGFNQNQIYELLAPSLKTLAEQADQYGLKLDDNTKRMIEQAEAGGHFDAIADPMDRVADILEKIFVQLGGNVDELGKMEIAADETAKKTAEGFGQASAAIYGIGDAAANTADMMASNFKRATDLSGEQIDLLVKSSIDKLSKLGDVPGLSLIPANEGPQPAPLAIPRFANGTPPGGRIVPPGFNDDNYFIGLKSGERFTVENGRNQAQAPPVVIERLNVTVVAAPGDSVEELSNKFIQALRNDTIGLVREMNRAGVGQNGQ